MSIKRRFDYLYALTFGGAQLSSNCVVDDIASSKNKKTTNHANMDVSELTIAELLAKVFPDAVIISPQVVVMGMQTSGKTSEILRLLFHYLIDNEHFKDDMGEALLKIFNTGNHMVTRRPTTVTFRKTVVGEIKISLTLDDEEAEFPGQEFDDIVNHVSAESKQNNHQVFDGELKLTITGPDLPNCSFTDLPGMVSENQQISNMVEKYMRLPNAILVIVEPSTHEDFDTSLVAPKLRKLNADKYRGCPGIFGRTLLVLSKCDRIRKGLEHETMSLIDMTSPQLVNYPYRHVVGAINNTNNCEQYMGTSFAEFKVFSRKIKEEECARFQEFRNSDGSPCSLTTQCTTTAVFHKMEQLSYEMIQTAMRDGLQSVIAKEKEVDEQIRRQLAPPLHFYGPCVSSAVTSSPDGTPSDEAFFTRKTFVDNFRASFGKTLLFGLEEEKSLDAAYFIESEMNRWPEGLTIADTNHRRDGLQKLEQHYHKFIENELAECVSAGVQGVRSCLSKSESPFHRIDRFPQLCQAIKDEVMQRVLPKCMANAKAAVSKRIGEAMDSMFGGLTREKLCRMSESLHLQVIVEVNNTALDLLSKGLSVKLSDALFVESEPFVTLRHQLESRPASLKRQSVGLATCMRLTTHEQLRSELTSLESSEATTLSPSVHSLDATVDLSSLLTCDSGSGGWHTGSVSASIAVGSAQYWNTFWTAAADRASAYDSSIQPCGFLQASASKTTVTTTSTTSSTSSTSLPICEVVVAYIADPHTVPLELTLGICEETVGSSLPPNAPRLLKHLLEPQDPLDPLNGRFIKLQPKTQTWTSLEHAVISVSSVYVADGYDARYVRLTSAAKECIRQDALCKSVLDHI